MFKFTNIKLSLPLMVCFLMFFSSSHAQMSTNTYEIRSSIVDEAGGVTQSDHFQINQSTGKGEATGSLSSTKFMIGSGYMYTTFFTVQTIAELNLPDAQGMVDSTIDIPITVTTDSSVGIAQFVVEYDSSIIEFIDARLGADIVGFIVSIINPDLPFAPTGAGTNENVLVQISGGGQNSFSGTNKEVVVLEFKVKAQSGTSPLMFDQQANHTFLTTMSLKDFSSSKLKFNDGTFTVIETGLATLTLPSDASGKPGTTIPVPITVTTDSAIGLAQFVIEYDSSIISFSNALVGNDISGFSVGLVNPELPFAPTTAGTNNNILVQISGGGSNSFTGTEKQVVILEFMALSDTGVSPLAFDRGEDRTFLTTTNLNTLAGNQITFVNGTVTTEIRKTSFLSTPATFRLMQNYPNPFNMGTVIRFDIPEKMNSPHIQLAIYNLQGQRIRKLIDAKLNAGTHHIIWDGRNDAGESIASGVYIYTLQAGNFKAMKKLLLMK